MGGIMKIVLVHGGWQGGWAWDDVASALEEKGHETFHPTMLGHEKDDDREKGKEGARGHWEKCEWLVHGIP